MANSSVLFLFSSNAEALYAQDAINIVGLPRGAVAHFRYNHRWVDSRVWEEVESAQKIGKPNPLEGTKVLCVFTDRSIHSGLPLLVPTRFGRIVSCETRGSVLHCYFALDGFYDWEHAARELCGVPKGAPLTEGDFRHAIKEHRRLLRLWLGEYENEQKEFIPRLPLWLFAVRATDDDLKKNKVQLVRQCPEDEDKYAWESVVRTLHSLPYFGDTAFYRISNMQMVGSGDRCAWLPRFPQDWATTKKRTEVTITPLMPQVYGYRVSRVAPYELSVDIYQGRDLSAKMKELTLRLSFEQSQFFRSQDTIPILGKFDSVKIVLFPVFGSPDGPSHMAIRAIAEAKDINAKTPACAEIEALSRSPTDTPVTKINGFDWYDPAELSAYQASREKRKSAGGKMDSHIHMAIVGAAPAAPELVIPLEAAHSMHYLTVGGLYAFLGFSLHLLATERILTGFASLLPSSILSWPVSTMWIAEAGLRVVGAWLIFRGFVYATRKLPTSGVK